MKLEDTKWNFFKVGDLFNIEKCKCSKAGDLDLGKIPYIGATNRNNGIMSFSSNSKLTTKGNCIAFICDGQGSVGYSIYKYENFIGSTTLKSGRNEKLNKYNGLFFTTCLDMNKTIYDYGYKRNEPRLKSETITLPSKIKNKPNYEFMEQYTKSIIDKKLNNYKKYAQTILETLQYKKIENLQEKEWREFFLTDIFTDIQRGKRLTKANQKMGDKPYVSSTASTNGVDNFISNKNGVRIFSNCISIANSGSVGASFYHPYNFVASDHITHLKNEELNEFIYLFIATLTNRFSDKYNFNREINDLRISREKILLPINSEDTPDYAYMEQYIINMKHKKIKQYLDYLEKQKKDS